MGLRFCNEVVVAAEQIYPTSMDEAINEKQQKSEKSEKLEKSEKSEKSKESEKEDIEKPPDKSFERRNSTLVNNQGFVAVPFIVDMGNAAPPSVRLVPCRPYSGAPIGKKSQFSILVAEKSTKDNFFPQTNVKTVVFYNEKLVFKVMLRGFFSRAKPWYLVK